MGSYVLLVCLCIIGTINVTDAAISGWGNPSISGPNGNGSFIGSFAEDLTPGSASTASFQATSNNTITYTLNPMTVNGASFTVDANTGALTFTAGTLDFETNPTLQLIVIASDADGDGTATATVSITDVNEAPVFTPANVSVSFCTDASAEGASVTSLTVSDPDTTAPNDEIKTLSITAGDIDNIFAINITTGAITVAAGITPANVTKSEYTLDIHAVDNGATPLTGTATVTISIGECQSRSSHLVVSMVMVVMATVLAILT